MRHLRRLPHLVEAAPSSRQAFGNVRYWAVRVGVVRVIPFGPKLQVNIDITTWDSSPAWLKARADLKAAWIASVSDLKERDRDSPTTKDQPALSRRTTIFVSMTSPNTQRNKWSRHGDGKQALNRTVHGNQVHLAHRPPFKAPQAVETSVLLICHSVPRK